MRIPDFYVIQHNLQGPLETGQRERFSKRIAETKCLAKKSMTHSCALSVVSLIAMNTFPILGSISALFGVAGIITGHDGMMLASNTQELISGDITQRQEIANDEQELHNQLTKGTWLLGSCFRICFPFSSRQAASH